MEVCACVCLYQGHSQILKVEEARSLCKDVWGKCPRCIPLRKFFQLKYLNSHVLTHSEHIMQWEQTRSFIFKLASSLILKSDIKFEL